MPENYVDTIVQRVAEIARRTVQTASPVSIATVLSVNPDGSVNVDDGQGGCARVAAVGNQVVQCGGTVVLGLEPAPGTTTNLCQVQFTINSSSKGCPVETRTEDEPVVVPPVTNYVFVDNRGHVYDYTTGALLATGAPYGGSGHPPHYSATYLANDYFATEGDISYGYSADFGIPANYAGALDDAGLSLSDPPNYDDLVIGDPDPSPDNVGYQGSNYAINNSVFCGRLVLGMGASSGRLMGLEIVNDAAGNHGPNWVVVIRQLSDFSILATNAATYLSDWVGDFFYDTAVTFAPSVAADPDGSFWVTIQNGRTDGNSFPNPMFNVSATDGSLIRTVELATPASSIYVYAKPVALL